MHIFQHLLKTVPSDFSIKSFISSSETQIDDINMIVQYGIDDLRRQFMTIGCQIYFVSVFLFYTIENLNDTGVKQGFSILVQRQFPGPVLIDLIH